MEAWQQVLASVPYAQTIWDALVVIVPLFCLMAYSGLFFLVCAAKITAISRKRSAYEKCSRQMAILGLLLGWLILIGSRVWLYYTQPLRQPGSMENFLLEMSWMLFSMGVLLSSIFYSLRNVLKNMPILHTTIGMISAVQNCVALALILFSTRVGASIHTTTNEALALPELFPSSWDDPLWTCLCYSLPLILAAPGAMAACWLVLRRKKDDYGRDYYNTMVPWCANWARYAWLCLWLLLLVSTGMQIWQEMQKELFDAQEAMIDNARILFWLLPPLLWTCVKRSKPPMKQAWLLFVALVIAAVFMLPFYLELTTV